MKKLLVGIMALGLMGSSAFASSSREIVCGSKNYHITVIQDFEKLSTHVSMLNKVTEKTTTETFEMECKNSPNLSCMGAGYLFLVMTEDNAKGLDTIHFQDRDEELKGIKFGCFVK